MNIRNYILACCMAIVPTLASAQQVEQQRGVRFMDHLGIGGTLGTTGIGIELATPLHKHFELRAGVSLFRIGPLKLKLTNSLRDVYSSMDYMSMGVDDETMDRKIEVGVDLTMVTGHFLVDYYPWSSSSFHITGGLYLGNNNVISLKNTENGSMEFLNRANENVHLYNETFGTRFRDVGIGFGDYILTADKNGNMATKMRVNLVRPYIGIGWGHNIKTQHNHKVHVNCDIGTQIWGTPRFEMNNGEKVVSTKSKDSGILSAMSGFSFWPDITITLSGDIF